MGVRNIKIAIFTEGTILMHKSALGHTREEIVRQVIDRESSIKDYTNYVPIGNAVHKIQKWVNQGVDIIYMTSRRRKTEINEIQDVLNRNHFPTGALEHRKGIERYKSVAERIMPDVIIEDDCESIGGENQMTYPHIRTEMKKKITSVVVKEFSGIDYLPDDITVLWNQYKI